MHYKLINHQPTKLDAQSLTNHTDTNMEYLSPFTIAKMLNQNKALSWKNKKENVKIIESTIDTGAVSRKAMKSYDAIVSEWNSKKENDNKKLD